MDSSVALMINIDFADEFNRGLERVKIKIKHIYPIFGTLISGMVNIE